MEYASEVELDQRVVWRDLRRQRVAYANLAAELPSSTLIRTDEGLEASVAAATKAILTHLSDRFTRHQRRKEIGAAERNAANRIRSPAAPANRFDLQEARLAVYRLVGLVVGLGGFVILGRVVADMLYGVRAFEPGVVALACGVMILVAFGASAAPAWRAARLEPVEALREE